MVRPGNVLAFDPGDTTGIAVFNQDAQLVEMHQLTLDPLLIWLNEYSEPVATVVVEDYILFKKRAVQQAGSRMKASQVIGAIKSFALRTSANVVMQKSDILPIATKFTQVKMPSDHSASHQISAYLHGSYWLINEGRMQTALEKEQANANKL